MYENNNFTLNIKLYILQLILNGKIRDQNQ